MSNYDQYNDRTIQTKEAVERLKEALVDLRDDGMLTPQAFLRKSGKTTLMRAVNHADRLCCRDLNIYTQVVAYVPPGDVNVLFDEQKRYRSNVQSAINELEDSQVVRNWFLGNLNSIYVIEIISRYLYVHREYPSGNEKTDKRLRKVSTSEFRGGEEYFRRAASRSFVGVYRDRPEEAMCYFDPNASRLVLGQRFEGERFLSFEARLMPGIMNLEDASSQKEGTYKILTPHTAFELLLYEAILYLLPASSVDARNLIFSQKEVERRRSLESQPVERTVVRPHFSF